MIAGICAGVDALEHAGILHDVKSTHSSNDDWVADKQVLTARANVYVDFAAEVAKKNCRKQSIFDYQRVQ